MQRSPGNPYAIHVAHRELDWLLRRLRSRGAPNPHYIPPPNPVTESTSYAGTLQIFNNSSPDYLAEVQVLIPLRNRSSTGRPVRSGLELRQAQLNVVQQKKNLRIEVRNAAYALEQGQARVEAARKARDLAQTHFRHQEAGAAAWRRFELRTLTAEHDLAIASSTLASAETAYEKSRVLLYSQTGQTLQTSRHLDRGCAFRNRQQACFACPAFGTCSPSGPKHLEPPTPQPPAPQP